MPPIQPSTAAVGLLAAAVLISGCRSAAPNSDPRLGAGRPDPALPPADTVRTTVRTGVRVAMAGVAALQEFTPDVPAVDSGVSASGATVIWRVVRFE